MASLTSSELQQLLLLTFLNNVVDLTSPGVGLGGDPPVALLLKLLLRILPALLLLLIIFGLLPSCFLSIIFPERKVLHYALTNTRIQIKYHSQINFTHRDTSRKWQRVHQPTSRQHSQIHFLIWKPELLITSRLTQKEENRIPPTKQKNLKN